MKKSVVVFAAHPDDETLGCGGTIVKRLKEGYDVKIVVITDGRHSCSVRGHYVDPTPEELIEIRKNEVIKAVQILGVPNGNIQFLDFEDTTLAKNTETLAKKCVEILAEINPVEIYFPY